MTNNIKMKDDLITISSCISVIMAADFTFLEFAVVEKVFFLMSHSLGQHRHQPSSEVQKVRLVPVLPSPTIFLSGLQLFFSFLTPYVPSFITLFSCFPQRSSFPKNLSPELSQSFFLWLLVDHRSSKKVLCIIGNWDDIVAILNDVSVD